MVARPRGLPIALLAAMILAGCGAEGEPPAARGDGGASEASPGNPAGRGNAPAPEGETASATTDLAADVSLRIPTHLFVERNVDVLVRRGGVVRKVLGARGEQVREGQVLCELDNDDLKLAVDLARIERDKADIIAGMSRDLHSEDLLSRRDLEEAEFDLKVAERELDLADHELEKSVIRAPFNGIVSARNVEVGQVLAEGDQRALFRVTALRPLRARLFLPQWSYSHLSMESPVTVHPSTSPTGPVPASVEWINQVLEPASGSAEILVRLPRDAPRSLRPGMEVLVQIDLRIVEGHLTVPREAVAFDLESPSRGQVFVRGEGGEERRAVRLGFLGDDRVEILSGLEEGEEVLLPAPRHHRRTSPRG